MTGIGNRIRIKGLVLTVALLTVSLGMMTIGEADAMSMTDWTKQEIKTIGQWLAERAIPIKSVQAGAGFDDLTPLKTLLGDARIVALGEATHGTREFFQFKHRMLEFLVREMGYSVFAIEASYPACNNINEYVLEGKGDPAAALASQGFWTWDTEEVRDMIAWMRKYNTTVSPDKKVMFVGYDIQHLERSLAEAVDYLTRVDPGCVETAEAALEPLADYEGIRELRKPENKARRDEIRAAYNGLLAYLTFDRNRFVRLSSESEYEEVMHYIRVMGQYFSAYAGGVEGPEAMARVSRDYFMAENIAWWMRRLPAGARMVVWAHNGHVKVGKLGGLTNMGGYLREWYGDEYYSLGFSFNRGGFQSCDMEAAQKTSAGCILTEFEVGPAEKGTGDWFFASAGIPAYVVDFRSAASDPVIDRWLTEPALMRSIGSGYSIKMAPRFMDPARLKAEYDGIIFIDRTTRARPNPTGRRPKK